VSGTFVNFGWVLTPLPNKIPIDGTTINLFVNGVNLGHPTYNNYREDIALQFPGFLNTGAPDAGGPVGYYYLDTTAYANGVHSIHWVATDDGGRIDGIGSRYFSIENTGAAGAFRGGLVQSVTPRGMKRGGDPSAMSEGMGMVKALLELGAMSINRDMRSLPVSDFSFSRSFEPLRVRTGFDLRKPAEVRYPGSDGILRIDIKELDRIVIGIGPDPLDEDLKRGRKPDERRPSGARYAGFLRVGGELRPLPIGSTFDAARGVFYWQPGPGFLGEYDFIFISSGTGKRPAKKLIRIKIGPKN